MLPRKQNEDVRTLLGRERSDALHLFDTMTIMETEVLPVPLPTLLWYLTLLSSQIYPYLVTEKKPYKLEGNIWKKIQ